MNNIVAPGAGSNCSPNETECNGPLVPKTTYTFQACALNDDGGFACTGPTPEYTTSAAPDGMLKFNVDTSSAD